MKNPIIIMINGECSMYEEVCRIGKVTDILGIDGNITYIISDKNRVSKKDFVCNDNLNKIITNKEKLLTLIDNTTKANIKVIITRYNNELFNFLVEHQIYPEIVYPKCFDIKICDNGINKIIKKIGD